LLSSGAQAAPRKPLPVPILWEPEVRRVVDPHEAHPEVCAGNSFIFGRHDGNYLTIFDIVWQKITNDLSGGTRFYTIDYKCLSSLLEEYLR
jgi:hypothetical protein